MVRFYFVMGAAFALVFPCAAQTLTESATPVPTETQPEIETATPVPATPAPPSAPAPPSESVAPTGSARASQEAVTLRPEFDPDRIGVAVFNVVGEGENGALLSALSSTIATELSAMQVFQVLTEQDVGALMQWDRTRTALGDNGSEARLAAVGASLGVPYVLASKLGRAGEHLTVELVLLDVKQANAQGRAQTEAVAADTLLAALKVAVSDVVRPLQQQNSGELYVQCETDGATVTLDGTTLGTTPMAPLSVAAGPHRLVIAREGYIADTTDVVVRPKRRTTQGVVLIPSPEWISDYNRTAWLWMAGAGGVLGVAAAVFVIGAGVWTAQRIEVYGYEQDAAYPRGQENRNALIITNDADYARLNIMRFGAYGLMASALIPAAASAALFIFVDKPGRYDHLLPDEGADVVNVSPAPVDAEVTP